MENFQWKEQQFKTPKEEIDFLRKQVAEKERELSEKGEKPNTDVLVAESVESYKNAPDSAIHDDMKIRKIEVDRIILNLSPENHDSQISELLKVLREKGVKNAFHVLQKLDNPHIDDDFHRYLVEYIK